MATCSEEGGFISLKGQSVTVLAAGPTYCEIEGL